ATVGCGYAAVAGLELAGGRPWSPAAMAAGGAGLLVAGAVTAIGLGAGRLLLVPPLVTGAVLLTVGVGAALGRAGCATPLAARGVLVVVAGGAAPRLALGITGTRAGPLVTQVTDDVGPVDAERLAINVRQAHLVLVSVSATVGALLVLTAP